MSYQCPASVPSFGRPPSSAHLLEVGDLLREVRRLVGLLDLDVGCRVGLAKSVAKRHLVPADVLDPGRPDGQRQLKAGPERSVTPGSGRRP